MLVPLTGLFTVTVAGETTVVAPGQAVILPAAETRQIRAAAGPAEALVCMAAGDTATTPENDARHPLPWAE